MEALDTNHDGILSADEIANAATSLKKLDKNGDGRLTEDELRPPPPGGRGGPPHGQPGPGYFGANPAGFRDEFTAHPSRPPRSPSSAGHDPSTALMAPHTPTADARAEIAPPRLEDDPVAARLDKAASAASGHSPHPVAAPFSLFDLLDTNHDGTLSEEELGNAPAVLKQLDLKGITLERVSPTEGGERRPLPPTPAP